METGGHQGSLQRCHTPFNCIPSSRPATSFPYLLFSPLLSSLPHSNLLIKKGWSCIDTLMIGTYHAVRRVFMARHEQAYQEQLKLQNNLTTNHQTTKSQITRLSGPAPLTMWEVACSGTVAGWVSCILVTPFEQVKFLSIPLPLLPSHLKFPLLSLKIR
jgi:hypothetical protein